MTGLSREDVYVARLTAALPPLLELLEGVVNHPNEDPNRLVILGQLADERIRPVFDCLWHLRLFGDARALVGKLRALGRYAIGPKMDEVFATIAADDPKEREWLERTVGQFPSAEDLALTAGQRAQNDHRAAALVRDAIEGIRQLQTMIKSVGPEKIEEREQNENKADEAKHLTRALRRAYWSYQYAESKNGRPLKDREAYDWLTEHGIEEKKGNRGELADYELPVFDTWARQVRQARNILNDNKNSRRAGRATGKSLVAADQIERHPASE